MLFFALKFFRMSNYQTVEAKIQNFVNSISLIAAITTCFILVGLGYYRYRLIDRVSIRLQGAIAIIDIARHLSQIKASHSNPDICRIIGYSVYFTDHLYLLLNVAIAQNIQFMLIQNIRPDKQKQWFRGYYSVILIIVINYFPLVSEMYGRDRKGRCRIIEDENEVWWNFLLVYMTNIPGTFYCLLIFSLALLKIRYKKQELRLIRGTENYFGSDPAEFLWTLYFRLSLYPLSCFITLFPFTLTMLLGDITGRSLHMLTFIFRLCRKMTGTLNFITMMSDPNCQAAVLYLWQSMFNFGLDQNVSEETEQESLQQDGDSATPYYHELEYPNGDRVPLREFIQFL